ncbi:IgGFc-binding protein [Holothuria leucospilota]|uniref:IgGFc-binding protein n=1 Tax=Holothuria leucospilota TaxID=206669 RepID=A0A9Q1H587_HOLLE|nr:IgGFc-binding protein [Holothuria leucospilota]
MVFGNCSVMTTCEDPTGQKGRYFNTCTNASGCVCPKDFLMKGGYCVPYNQCECFHPDSRKIFTKDEFYVDRNCTRRCECRDAGLICDNDYRCSDNALCEERNSVHQY